MKIEGYEVDVMPRRANRRMLLHYRKAEQRLFVTVPVGTPERRIREFLTDNLDWIRRQAGSAPAWQSAYAPGERHWCLGRLVTLGKDAPAGEEAYLRWRDAQLRPVVLRLVEKWRKPMGLTVSSVSFRRTQSRWGSCNGKQRKLNFSTRLAMFEEPLIELTVVHELCHLFHMNHSPAFWAEMTKWLPDWKIRRERRESRDVRPLPPL